jgi:uncharacterized protein
MIPIEIKLLYFPLLLVCLLIVALLYSTVGHGGGTAYLAIFALFNLAPESIKVSALLLNIIVSGIASFQFYKTKLIDWKLLFPFILGSIPLSFIGASIDVDPLVYKRALGIFLLLATARLILQVDNGKQEKKYEPQFLTAILIGMCIGFLSGCLGIGGGIILSPIILFFKWSDIKHTSAVSALFIFCNSVAGIFAILSKDFQIETKIFAMGSVVIIGGMIGSYYGSVVLNNKILKQLLSLVLFTAAIKLIIT